MVIIFAFDAYKTEQLSKVIQASSNRVEQPIRDLIEGTFAMFPELPKLEFSSKDIFTELYEIVKHIDEVAIKRCLKNDFKMEPEKQQRYKYYSLKDSEVCENPVWHNRNGTPYIFKREEFTLFI